MKFTMKVISLKRMEVGAVVAAAPKEQVKTFRTTKWTNRLINWGTHRT